MKESPLVSVVIPVYNSSEKLRKTVRSLYKQDYSNFEILLMDDGSSNISSLNLYASLAKQFPNVRLFHNKNQGVVRTRIEGINNAQGEYIMFADHDDFYLKKSISKLVEAITISNADIIVANAYSQKISWLPLKTKQLGVFTNRSLQRNDFLKKEYLNFFGWNHFPVATWGKLYKSSLLKNIEWDIYDYNFCEDIILNCQIFYKIKTVEFIPDFVYIHNYGGISSVSNIDNLFKGYADIYNLRKKFLQLSNLDMKEYLFIELKNIMYHGLYSYSTCDYKSEYKLIEALVRFRKSNAFKDLNLFYNQKDIFINHLYNEDYNKIIIMRRKFYKKNLLKIKFKKISKKLIEQFK